MEAKDKAKELVRRVQDLENCEEHYDESQDGRICKHLAKQCALIVAGVCYG